MLILKNNTQLKQLKKLKAIQEEKENIQSQLNKCELFPKCPDKAKYIIGGRSQDDLSLAQYITLLWTGRIDYNCFNANLQSFYNIDNASEYFEELGNYFLNLSKNIEHRKPLKDKLKELKEKEYKLKDKLGIK